MINDNRVTYCLTISYDGIPFVGWQRQSGDGETVQGLLEKALRCLWGESLHAEASGRTDSGVHAIGQVVSIIATPKFSAPILLRALNAHLPHTIRVIKAKIIPGEFHARFDARAKTYEYHIYRKPVLSPFFLKRSWHITKTLDLQQMRRAAKIFIGRHDFAAFASNPGYPLRSTIRTLFHLRIIEMEPLLLIRVTASGFLYRMVRNITGALVHIGEGKRTVEELEVVLKTKKRSLAPASAPAWGLYLKEVHYGKRYPSKRDLRLESEE